MWANKEKTNGRKKEAESKINNIRYLKNNLLLFITKVTK